MVKGITCGQVDDAGSILTNSRRSGNMTVRKVHGEPASSEESICAITVQSGTALPRGFQAFNRFLTFRTLHWRTAVKVLMTDPALNRTDS